MIPWRPIIAAFAGAAALLLHAAESAPAPQATAATVPPSAAGAAKDANRPEIETGPAVGWTFPVFSDQEGYRVLTLRGSEARLVSSNQIDVTGFSAVSFSGDATERVDSILLSPQATFFPKENKAAGNSYVRLILSGRPDTPNDDVEVTGRGWTYDRTAKKVSITHDVRVTFQAQLHDILK